jgi:hypothetical protein
MRDGLCFTHGSGSATASRPQAQVAGRRAGLRAEDRGYPGLHTLLLSSVAGFRSGFMGQLWLPLFLEPPSTGARVRGQVAPRSAGERSETQLWEFRKCLAFRTIVLNI